MIWHLLVTYFFQNFISYLLMLFWFSFTVLNYFRNFNIISANFAISILPKKINRLLQESSIISILANEVSFIIKCMFHCVDLFFKCVLRWWLFLLDGLNLRLSITFSSAWLITTEYEVFVLYFFIFLNELT